MKLIARRPARWTLMAVAALVLLSVPVVAQIQFSDVETDNPHRDDINTVARERWFVGYRDGTYKPDQNISPSEMTRVLSRAFDDGITRAEFASFLVAGNEWRQIVKAVPNFKNWRMCGSSYSTFRYFVGFNPDIDSDDIWWWDNDNNRYVEPGRYRLNPDRDARWMRLGHIPDGGQNYDTIAATDAPLAGYFQDENTREAHIIEIEPTDIAFWYICY